MVDFVRPTARRRRSRSATTASSTTRSFHAGTDSGTEYEYVDEANRLHFYILDQRGTRTASCHYTVAVRSLDGAGPQTRGVALARRGPAPPRASRPARSRSPTRARAASDPERHPQDASAFLTSDVYRLSASATGTGWAAHLKNALATAKFGETVQVPVYVEKAHAAAPARSRSRRSPRAIRRRPRRAVCTLADDRSAASVPATLALTLGAPAAFGPFTPGVAKDYTASTTATVISTAGDATLSVADPSTTATGHLVNGTFALPQPLQASARDAPAPTRRVGGRAPTTCYLRRPGLQRRGRDQLQAADRRQRRAAHRHVRQDADVHAQPTTTPSAVTACRGHMSTEPDLTSVCLP